MNQQPLNKLFKQNLTRWVLIPSICIILLLGGYVAYDKTQDFALRNVIIAQSLSKQITSHVDDAGTAMNSLAKTLTRYDSFWFQMALTNFLQSYPHIERILYLSPKGRILAASPEATDLLTMQLFIDMVSDVPTIISTPITSPATHNLVVYLGMRMSNGNILVGELSMLSLQKHLNNLLRSDKETLVLCDSYGNIISHPDYHRVAIQDNIGHLDILSSVQDASSKTTVYKEDGRYFIGTAFNIKQLNWIILISKPVRDAFLPMLSPIVSLLTMVLLLFFVFVNLLQYKLRESIIKPFARFTEFIERTARGQYAKPEPYGQNISEMAIIEEKFDDMIMQVKLRENQIRENEERFRQLVESIHEVYWITDVQDNRVIYASPSYETIWGRSRLSLYENPESFFLAIKQEDRLAVIETFNQLRTNGDGLDMEFRIELPNGEERWIRAQSFPVHDEDGIRVRLAGVAEDITERKAIQQALVAAKQDAENANKSKTEFLTNISHELRTPLNGILGMLQLTRDSSLTPEQAENIDTALTSSKVLLNVINDILNIAQIEAGKLSLANQPFSLQEILETIYKFFEHTTKSKGIELSVDIEPGFPPILVGDEVRIRQILFNLVGNSVKFTNQGHIRIHASRLPFVRRTATAEILLTVEDTGIGIPFEKIDYVFESFTQVDGTYTRQYQGTGLGLGIVRSLVHMMNGTITVDSEAGAGTTMYVSLQLALPNRAQHTAKEETKAIGPFKTGLSILLVEDDRVNQIAISRMLEKMGHFPTCCGDGEKALHALNEKHFDCIFMDIQMPIMDGMEATRMIRTSPSMAGFANIPIIALTAHAMPNDRDNFLKAGMNDYVSKPVSFEQLAEAINRVVE
jgi:PAS domain S-box